MEDKYKNLTTKILDAVGRCKYVVLLCYSVLFITKSLTSLSSSSLPKIRKMRSLVRVPTNVILVLAD